MGRNSSLSDLDVDEGNTTLNVSAAINTLAAITTTLSDDIANDFYEEYVYDEDGMSDADITSSQTEDSHDADWRNTWIRYQLGAYNYCSNIKRTDH